jgi:hypothetical protein
MRRPDLKDREIRVCAACDSKFSPTSENEFCPVCMLREVLIGGVESGESLSQDPVKPAQQDATQRFEHYELVRREDGTPAELGRGAMGITYVQSVRRRSALHGDTESHQREVSRRRAGAASFFARSPLGGKRSSPKRRFRISPWENRKQLLLRDGVCGRGDAVEVHSTPRLL